MNKTFAGVLSGISIGMAGILALFSVAALLLGQVSFDWDGAWFVLRSILMVGLYLFNFRYFQARAR